MGHIVYIAEYKGQQILIRDDSALTVDGEQVYLPDTVNRNDFPLVESEDYDELLPVNLTLDDLSEIKITAVGQTSGYDGHSLRAYAYYFDKMPDINLSVNSINSIEHKYPEYRQESKSPTFALTYQGTYRTLMKNCGFSQSKAQEIEKRFQDLYVESINWVNGKLAQASIDGYITGAFGLRIRTPIIAQTVRGTKYTPFEAEAEGRTAGNALGQSWCLLNSRAGTGTMRRIRNDEYLRLGVKPCAQIHDAQYYLICDNIRTLKNLNQIVVEECQWQDHPDISHDEVKLGGQLSVFYPSWDEEIKIPNNATEDEILSIVSKGNV